MIEFQEGIMNRETSLPILGGSNGTTWPARIAKLQSEFRDLTKNKDADAIARKYLQEMFVKSESALSSAPPSGRALVASLDLIFSRTANDQAALTTNFLFELQRALQTETGLRTEQIDPQVPGHAPARPNALPMLLNSTLEWFSAESFLELHPIEQAALVHARFLDVQFFPLENTRLARFAADFYLIKAELPPLMILAEVNQYKAALHQAILMNTQSLINIYAESTERVLSELLSEINKNANR